MEPNFYRILWAEVEEKLKSAKKPSTTAIIAVVAGMIARLPLHKANHADFAWPVRKESGRWDRSENVMSPTATFSLVRSWPRRPGWARSWSRAPRWRLRLE